MEENTISVIYVSPNYDEDITEFGDLSALEKKQFAANCDEMKIMSLDKFQFEFNNERISDLGYIFFV